MWSLPRLPALWDLVLWAICSISSTLHWLDSQLVDQSPECENCVGKITQWRPFTWGWSRCLVSEAYTTAGDFFKVNNAKWEVWDWVGSLQGAGRGPQAYGSSIWLASGLDGKKQKQNSNPVLSDSQDTRCGFPLTKHKKEKIWGCKTIYKTESLEGSLLKGLGVGMPVSSD